ATRRGGRCGPHRRRKLLRAPPEAVFLATAQSTARGPVLSYSLTRRACRCVCKMRISGRLAQLVPQPALTTVPAQCPRPLARSAAERTAADALRRRGLHVTAATCATSVAEQTRHLWPVISGQRRDAHRSRARSQAPRCRNRVLQHPPYLEPETPSSPTCSLC